MPALLPDDPQLWDRLLSAFTDLINLEHPPLPEPGHQTEWEALDPPDERARLPYQASSALRRLLDLGATTEDLYALARGIRALTLCDALDTLDPEDDGERAGELYGNYQEMRRSS